MCFKDFQMIGKLHSTDNCVEHEEKASNKEETAKILSNLWKNVILCDQKFVSFVFMNARFMIYPFS